MGPFRADQHYADGQSFWRARANIDMFPVPDHFRSTGYDVVVVGGGLHGLWTAFHLKKAEPDLAVAVIERRTIGFGASGRNGGFVTPKVGMRLEDLERKYGGDATRRTIGTMQRKIGELARTLADEAIECELDHRGLLLIATNVSQEKRVLREVKVAQRVGLDAIEPLDRQAVRRRLDSPTYLSGAFDPHAATVDPLQLALGLARRCVELGVELFEDVGFEGTTPRGDGLEVRTTRGAVRAGKCVLTVNAWAGHDPAFCRTVLPVYTYILMSQPLDEDHWSRIGWSGREAVEDARLHLHFYRRTRDGRILWGGSDNRAPLFGRIEDRFDKNDQCFSRLEQTFKGTFPALDGVAFEHRWGGCFAITPDFVPHYGALADGRLLYGHGCCGHGVGLSYFGGEILRDLVLGRPSEADDLLFMRGDHGRFPREPLRSVGAHLALAESRWFDDAQERGTSPAQEPLLLRLAPRIFG